MGRAVLAAIAGLLLAAPVASAQSAADVDDLARRLERAGLVSRYDVDGLWLLAPRR